MPITPTYPGVYIEELPSGVHTITGVATSIAAFVDFFTRGPMNTAVQLLSAADLDRELGGLDPRSEASYAIQQFYANGGSEAWAVRVASGTFGKATGLLQTSIGGANTALTVSATSEGSWGNNLRVSVDYNTSDPAHLFNLAVAEINVANGRTTIVRQESFRELSMDATSPNYVQSAINGVSSLITAAAQGSTRPVASGTLSGTNFTFPANPPGPGQPLRIDVTLTSGGTPQTADANLGMGAIQNIQEAAARLQAAIRNANPGAPAWSQATVSVAGGHLQVIAGPSTPDAVFTFAASPEDAGTVGHLDLVSADVTANVAKYQIGSTTAIGAQGAGTQGNDGTPPDATAIIGSQAANPPTGIYALDKVSRFNILCLPRIARVSGTTNNFDATQYDAVVSAATTYCEARRAFLILDTPSNVTNVQQMQAWIAGKGGLRDNNVALYFPRVQVADPKNNFQLRSFGASGTIAGLYARTDAARGVWKAPAGTETVLVNVQQLDYKMTDLENGTLNPVAVDCLRVFDAYGIVCWGARTLEGSDQIASDWKYVPVRRFALFLEESLYQGTQWVVFEPNDEPLWAQVRLNVGAFMHDLFRKGAFQGQTPRDAYLVKCDGETTTQTDIDLGIVNILVAFAPLKPAEFVIIQIRQKAGQIQT